MQSFELPPANPAELASVAAKNVLYEPQEIDRDPDVYLTLSKLEGEAKALEFVDKKYFVETSRALSIPSSFESSAENTVTYHSFYKLSFEGTFRGYTKVAIGRIIGSGSIRAYCLGFEEVTLLPYFDRLPEDHILHIPALAVDSIDQTI